MYFCGIDLGSSYTKAVVIDSNGDLVASAIQKTGIDFTKIAQTVLDEVLKLADLTRTSINVIVSTGIGRNNCELRTFSKPEIGCFAKGSFHEFGGPCVVVDIGGQDNKVIKLSESGKQLSFKMNRKCAAGTGSFLEDIALRLDMSTKNMNALAQQSTSVVPIGSYCTVFAGTEVIHQLRVSDDTPGIMRGIYSSVVKRIFEMASLDEKVILTGGAIANNPVLIELFNEKLKGKGQALVPQNPQYVGALGAAIYGLQNQDKKKEP